jgi:hypothetical protein
MALVFDSEVTRRERPRLAPRPIWPPASATTSLATLAIIRSTPAVMPAAITKPQIIRSTGREVGSESVVLPSSLSDRQLSTRISKEILCLVKLPSGTRPELEIRGVSFARFLELRNTVRGYGHLPKQTR